MPNVLIIGATRGLGAELAKAYASESLNLVYGTTRSAEAPKDFHENVKWIRNIDLMNSEVGGSLVNQLGLQGVGGGMVDNPIGAFDIVVSILVSF